ncbi:MAG: ATP-binding cassette domain-containing protein, partial [Gammaproteobacteria bacterium]|nr:ATP-binding cassette domain-containing protein [Gammaproteobacteria bacterium]
MTQSKEEHVHNPDESSVNRIPALISWLVQQYPIPTYRIEKASSKISDQSVKADAKKCIEELGFHCVVRSVRHEVITPKYVAEVIWLAGQPILIDPHHQSSGLGESTPLLENDLVFHVAQFASEPIEEVWEIYAPLQVDDRAHHPHLKEIPHWFWSVARPMTNLYAHAILGSIFINIFAIITSLYAMNVYDRVVPCGAVETLITLSIGMVVLHVFDLVFKVMRSSLIDTANRKVDTTLTNLIFDHLLHIPLAVRPRSLGAFSSLVTQFESFRDFFASATITTLVDIPFMLLFVMMIAYMGGPLVWTVVLTIPCIAVITMMTQQYAQGRVKKQQQCHSQKNALLVEALVSIESIKFWSAEDLFQRRWQNVVRESAALNTETKNVQTLSSYACQLVQALSYVAMISYGVVLIWQGQLTMGALVGCSILSSRALAPILQVGQLVLRWQQAKNSYEGMNQLMQLPSEVTERPLTPSDLNGVFEFDHVKFTYNTQQPLVLNDITVTFQPGDRIGVIGANGSGKSTLIKMLLGLYHPTEGHVRLDGFDLRQFHLSALRQTIGYVPQDVQLIYGTLRDNLIVGCYGITQNQLIHAAEQAGLMSWIGGHPQGFDMMIEERGQNLSGGQRQAIALARALITNPKILILDEPTSALDAQAEALFLEQLEKILSDKTLIIVTHRQAPLRLCKEVLIMHQG